MRSNLEGGGAVTLLVAPEMSQAMNGMDGIEYVLMVNGTRKKRLDRAGPLFCVK